ncbi:MAG TPA: NUDIX domain-containing protein [Gaiellaceae bacterium]|jgi:ADP-ribose pyrophosphatase YjhB (NUDIX family)
MGRSPFFDEWKSCPRCTADLEITEARATCPRCGLVVWANPAPTISALVLDEGGKVLLARRAADPGRGLWDLLGGFMIEGELPLETLARELHEEIGVEIDPLEFFGAWPDRYGKDGVWTLNLYWTARIRKGEPRPADDVAEVVWFAPDELPSWSNFAFENTVSVLQAWKSGL